MSFRSTGFKTRRLVSAAVCSFLIIMSRPVQGAELSDIQALWQKGQESLEKGDLDSAYTSFGAALELDRGRARSWNYLGGVYFKKKDYFNALLHFKQALLLDPRDVRACNNIATAYEHLEEFQKAETFYLKALEVDEYYPVTHRNLGVLYAYRLNKPALARTFWERFLVLAPSGEESDRVRRELESLGEKDPEGEPD